MTPPFRHSICNELFKDLPFARACASARAAGYTGIEIAPFTLAEDAASLPADVRRECRAAMESEGLEFVGLHWLLVSPKGLHVTTPDKALRERSWDYLRRLVDLCADLGSGGIMVFGSPKQRGASGGLTPAAATAALADGLASLAPHAAERGITVLLEQLSPDQTDVVTTMEEAAAVVNRVGSGAVRTMFDCHNARAESEPHPVLVDRYFDLIRHVHVNEADGRHPGTGAYNYRALLDVLARRDYPGWLSLEVFDFSAGAERIAAESLNYLQSEIARIQ